MAIFPKCTFEVLLAGGGVVPGQRAEGTLVLHAPSAIPRADHIQFDFVSAAHAYYGSGNNRRNVQREIFRGAFRIDLPKGELPAGTHRHPFWIDIPAWLTPGITGADFALGNVIQTSLDVSWAVDPNENFVPDVLLAPMTGQLTPAIVRSPTSFHQDIVLEATLHSSVVAVGEPLRGQLALRSGFDANFEHVDISYVSMAKMRFARGDLRPCVRPPTLVRIPRDALRSGASVAFELPCPDRMLPTLRNSIIDHDGFFVVRASVPWKSDPAFEWRLEVLPRGSQVIGEGRSAPVGNERLGAIAAAMASGSGLPRGRGRELVAGTVGPVHVTIVDAPRHAALGVDVDFTFPDVQLDIDFRRHGALGGVFGRSPLLPDSLQGYSLDARPDGKEIAAFFANILRGAEHAQDIRLSDHHLGFHHPLPNDETPRMVAIAAAAHERAVVIDRAIRALPWPPLDEHARAAWIATAAEQQATLIPTGPSLHGLVIATKILGGEERRIRASIRTVPTKTIQTMRCDLDLANAPLPESAFAMLESDAEPGNELLRVVRAAFPTAHVLSRGAAVTLERAEWTPDPRILLPALEAFLWLLLETRGERRVESPYR